MATRHVVVLLYNRWWRAEIFGLIRPAFQPASTFAKANGAPLFLLNVSFIFTVHFSPSTQRFPSLTSITVQNATVQKSPCREPGIESTVQNIRWDIRVFFLPTNPNSGR